MASRWTIVVLLYVVCFLYFSTGKLITGLEISDNKLSDALLKKGYASMSLIFSQEQIFDQILQNPSSSVQSQNMNSITFFCPLDKAFQSLTHLDPPLTLLQYHAVPNLKINRELLEASPRGLKIDTLLHEGHPLVKTTAAANGGSEVSINNVKITDWEVYNDGNIIVHGVEYFFDPAFPILYPSLLLDGDHQISKNNNKMMVGMGCEVGLRISLFLAALVLMAFGAILGRSSYARRLCRRADHDDKYVPIGKNIDDVYDLV